MPQPTKELMSATTTYETHPLAALIPAMSDDEYARLREDIAANGLYDAITLYDGKVLDGRHRLRACEATGTVPRFVEYTDDSPAQFVISHNLSRRHLTTSQRAMIVTSFLPELEAEAAERQKRLGRELGGAPLASNDAKGADRVHSGKSAQVAGDSIGVSFATVERAKHVLEHDPELAQKVRDGDITVNAARDMVRKAETNGQKRGHVETGLARPAGVRRIAMQAEGMALAIEALNLTKSCERMTIDQRSEALDACKAGLRALNTLANALGR